MSHYYTYRAVNGDDIRMEFDGNVVELRRKYMSSATPISSIDGVPEDLSDFIQMGIDNVNRDILNLQKTRKSLQDEKALRKQRKTIVWRTLTP